MSGNVVNAVDVGGLRALVDGAGQGHVLAFWERLNAGERAGLARQIGEMEWGGMARLVEGYVKGKAGFGVEGAIEPAPYYAVGGGGPADPAGSAASGRTWDRAAARRVGEELIRKGKVAGFTVAGGQGTRLGYDGPKGCFPAGAITGKPLFQFFAEGILAAERRSGMGGGAAIRWAIMTSPQNHGATVEFFEAHRFFGLRKQQVSFFPQGVMASFDKVTGKLLMSGRGEIAASPDGHGGSITALHKSGVLGELAGAGVEHVSYFQVDNPEVRVLDPVFLGLHAGGGVGGVGGVESSAEMSSKMIPKAYAEEKLGLFCSVGGRVQVIEYSDLPMDRQRETLADGSLRFLAGSIAVHAMSVEFLKRLNEGTGFELPWHRAEKKIACVDAVTGEAVEPREANGMKLERFVFDALPMCRASVVLETVRRDEFAPIKNAEGVDSPASCARIQTERAAAWLERVGVRVARRADGEADCVIELSPLTACEAEDLERPEVRRGLPGRIGSGERVLV